MRPHEGSVCAKVMAVARFSTDDEAVALANDCAFGLGSAVFSRDRRRANAIGARLEVRRRKPRLGSASDPVSREPC